MFCWNSPTHNPSGIQQAVRTGGSGPSRNLVCRGCRELPLLRTQGVSLSPAGTCSRRSQGRGSSRLRDGCIARTMCYFYVLQAAISRSDENISILCARLGHLTRRSQVSNPEDKRQAKTFGTVYKAVVETSNRRRHKGPGKLCTRARGLEPVFQTTPQESVWGFV